MRTVRCKFVVLTVEKIMKPDLLELVEQYWNLVYTKNGDAGRVLHEIKAAIAAIEAAKVEQPSKKTKCMCDYTEHCSVCSPYLWTRNSDKVEQPVVPQERKEGFHNCTFHQDSKVGIMVAEEFEDKLQPDAYLPDGSPNPKYTQTAVELPVVALIDVETGLTIGMRTLDRSERYIKDAWDHAHAEPLVRLSDAQAAIAAQGEKK
jgi:hypothetical protein